jgi:N,N'-diacetylbacillosaminyl-diphospho-undecaprenol alpha-1,3-N-acetylgalactosaminyltransferase
MLCLRQELAGKSSKIITMVARPLWSKGIREFVEAYNILMDCMKDAVFIVVGEKEEGNPDNVPDKYIVENHSERLQFIGWRDDVKEIYALSTIVVLPSYREGTPKSLLEAMAMGKAIVTTDAPGCREAVDHGKNGLLVPVGNSQKLAKSIYELATNKRKRTLFGRYSRKKAIREFDEKIVISQLLSKMYDPHIPGPKKCLDAKKILNTKGFKEKSSEYSPRLLQS